MQRASRQTMTRHIQRAVLVLLALTAVALPTASATVRHGCHKTFTLAMFKRAADLTYAGTRIPPRGAYGRLWRYAKCQRPPSTEQRARNYWGHTVAAWEIRLHPPSVFTGYTVSGLTSTFGPPTDGSGTTADGGTDDRACIAIRDDSTLGRTFLVTIGSHHADLIHCDWGPAAFTGRAIDVTGAGAEAMGIDPNNFPTGSYGTAQETRMIAQPTKRVR